MVTSYNSEVVVGNLAIEHTANRRALEGWKLISVVMTKPMEILAGSMRHSTHVEPPTFLLVFENVKGTL